MLPAEEAALRAQDVRVRYVPAPAGRRGFHMGHYKLWAWQHTEYARIQLLDADVLPLVNMDRFFFFDDDDAAAAPLEHPSTKKNGGLATFAFLGCPGRHSVVNAGWFSLRPSCAHFRGLVGLLAQSGGGKGGRRRGAESTTTTTTTWGVALRGWRNADGRAMPEGWDFFDARGNQGHMYAYFRFYAADLALVYADRVEGYRRRAAAHESGAALGDGDDVEAFVVAEEADRRRPDAGDASQTQRATADERRSESVAAARKAIADAAYGAFPCPFAPPALTPAYHHFTGNVKPWTRYDPDNRRFAQWYAVLADIGIDVRSTLFNASALDVPADRGAADRDHADASFAMRRTRRRRQGRSAASAVGSASSSASSESERRMPSRRRR